MIYFDYAATTPMSDNALSVFTQASKTYYGNSMSLHDIGTAADALLSACREQLARALNGHKDGIYFTSGGSESNFLAITSLAKANSTKGKHILTTPFEHSSVMSSLHYLEDHGFTYSFVSVNDDGLIDIDDLKQKLQDDTILVIMGHVNSEIGCIQPIHQIGNILQKKGILFHVDAVQSFGKMPVDVKKNHISSLSISSHKLYGPKGVGACYINPSSHWQPFLEGGTHEYGFRQGTVNVPGIAAFITAMSDAIESMEDEWNRIEKLRKYFVDELIERKLPVFIEGPANTLHTMPQILPLRVSGIEGQLVMLECNRQGLAISTGAACKIGQSKPSKAMIAIGRTEMEAQEFIRLSFGKRSTKEEVNEAMRILERVINYVKDDAF